MRLYIPKAALIMVFFYWLSMPMLQGQTSSPTPAGSTAQNTQLSDTKKLEKEFFAALRTSDTSRFLSYVSSGGVNVGPQAEHLSWEEVNDEMNQHRGLYCKLFDSSCMEAQIALDNSDVRACSYRELLTKSKKVRTAVTETTRNGVRQAVLVAEVKNDKCVGVGLVDFIFNLQSDGWKLFSIP